MELKKMKLNTVNNLHQNMTYQKLKLIFTWYLITL